MGIKFFSKEKGEPRFLVNWKTGYIQFWEDWSQFARPREYNWLNFRPIWFEIDYDKLAGEHLGIEFGLMGFNLRLHQFIRDNEKGKKLKKDIKKIEVASGKKSQGFLKISKILDGRNLRKNYNHSNLLKK